MFEPAEHVKMPLRGKGKPGERGIGNVARSVRAVERVLQEELAANSHRFTHRDGSVGTLIGEQRIEHVDRGVERAVL